MIKTAATVVLWALFALLLAITLNAAFGAPAAPPAPEDDSPGYLIVSSDMWARVEQALAFWYGEAQRLKVMKGCA